MKRSKYIITLLMLLGAVYFLITLIPPPRANKDHIKVLFIYNKTFSGGNDHIIKAYKSVLEEEGVAFEFQGPSFILSAEPAEYVKSYPVIIFADGISRSLPYDTSFWTEEYLKEGGSVAVIYDAGSMSMKGNYLDRGIFTQLLDVDYVLYNRLQDSNNAYNTGYIQYKDQKSADLFQVPPGKLDAEFYVNGYSYGRLVFPLARVKLLPSFDPKKVHAFGITESEETHPLITLQKKHNGHLLYVNLPLGHLKAHADDLQIRSILRSFLFDTVKIPHLVNMPGGKAGLVINWHIDWQEDWEGIEFMLENGYFTPHIKYSIHNTAGDFTDKPGDGLGFDACGKGKKYIKKILKYGTLGSHGGWAHNWFYRNILSGRFGKKEIEKYIVKNCKCLQSISGYPVTEYSAPNGVHPQPLLSRILEEYGIFAYYYTGDSGSAPNRTFFEKKMISPNQIAFPVLGYRHTASFYEMKRDGVSHKEFRKWSNDLLQFLLKNRTVRLIYSHSYDVKPYYPKEFKKFILDVDRHSKEGRLLARPMTFFANFTRRFLKTKYRFIESNGKMEIQLANPEGLADVTVAVPLEKYEKPHFNKSRVEIQKDSCYYYLTIKENINEKTLFLHSRGH